MDGKLARILLQFVYRQFVHFSYKLLYIPKNITQRKTQTFKKKSVQYDFAPFAVVLLTVCCRATTKTKTAWSSCTISNPRIVFVSKTRYKWQSFWFVFNLKSLSRCYVHYFFLSVKTSFVLVYSIAWNWFLLTTITIQNIPRIKCGYTTLCKCIRVFGAIKKFCKGNARFNFVAVDCRETQQHKSVFTITAFSELCIKTSIRFNYRRLELHININFCTCHTTPTDISL